MALGRTDLRFCVFSFLSLFFCFLYKAASLSRREGHTTITTTLQLSTIASIKTTQKEPN